MKPAVASMERIGLCHHHRQTTRQTVLASYIVRFSFRSSRTKYCSMHVYASCPCSVHCPYPCETKQQQKFKTVLMYADFAMELEGGLEFSFSNPRRHEP